MKTFQYTTESSKTFDAVVQALEKKSAEHGFSVLHTHDVAATLTSKGFPREPLKIVEICNARYANEALKRDIAMAVMLPCPISVYTQGGKTFISTMLPSSLAEFYPNSGLEPIAAEVEKAVLKIIEEAKA
jgi:uncharacterized protein (DUF302 family)